MRMHGTYFYDRHRIESLESDASTAATSHAEALARALQRETSLQSSVDELTEALEDSKSRVAEKEREACSLSEELTQAEVALKNSAAEALETHEEAQRKLEAAVEGAKAQVTADLTDKLTAAQGDLEAEWGRRQAAWGEEREALEGKLEVAQEAISDLKRSHTDDLVRLKMDNESLQEDLERVRGQQSQSTVALEALRTQYQEEQAKALEMEAGKAVLESQVKDLALQLDASQAESESLTSALGTAKQAEAAAKAAAEDLQAMMMEAGDDDEDDEEEGGEGGKGTGDTGKLEELKASIRKEYVPHRLEINAFSCHFAAPLVL